MSLIQPFQQLKKYIDDSHSILITTCNPPDGDAIASEISLANIITQLKPNVHVTIINDQELPYKYHFMTGSDRIIHKPLSLPEKKFELAITVDCGPERLSGISKEAFFSSLITIAIDHHIVRAQTPVTLNIDGSHFGSTAELIYHFFEFLDGSVSLNMELAQNIYTGIIFDTGGFQYDATNGKTHRIAAQLLDFGLNHTVIHEHLFRSGPLAQRLLLGRTLQKLHQEERILWASVSLEDLRSCNAHSDFTDSIIDVMSFTDNSDITVLFKQKNENEWKVSFRSHKDVDVAKLARSLTEKGGGHKKASGCTLSGTFESVKQQVLEAVKHAL